MTQFAEGRLRTLGGDLAIDILIAEDEPSILESLDFILRRAGWSISSVTDGDAVLDGVRRLVPLEVIDRIEPVPAHSIRFAAGRLRLSIDGRIVPLAAMAEVGDRAIVSVLRLRDGPIEIAYAIGEALDIVSVPSTIVAAREPGPVAGVVGIDGDQIEMLDVHWLFATHGDDVRHEAPPVCLIEGSGSAWMTTFLKPALEGAGYRVATSLPAGERPAVVLTMDPEPAVTVPDSAVVRLRHDRPLGGRDDHSIYRYDRPGLLAALAERAGRR